MVWAEETGQGLVFPRMTIISLAAKEYPENVYGSMDLSFAEASAEWHCGGTGRSLGREDFRKHKGLEDYMNTIFQYQDVTYSEPAAGWVDGVYYPRKEQREDGGSFLKEQDGLLVIGSRVFKEIEESGYGVYYYEESTRLTAVLDGSNYRVTAAFVNPLRQPYTFHIRVNNVVKEESVTVEPGEEKQVAFTACMTDGGCELCFAAGALSEIGSAVLEGEIYLKDISVEPEEEKVRREKPRLYLVSDSTVQSYEKYFYPQTGWGQVLYQFFQGAEEFREYPAEHCTYSLAKAYELPGLVIENRSIGGRSARSFYDEGKLDQILEVICPGDYMFVQFAHNDATAVRPNRYSSPEDFPFYIQRYIDACKRRGVQCVLVTPVAMRVPREGGRFTVSFGPYREKLMEMAREQGLPLLDLGGRSTAYLNQIGTEESKSLYLWLAEGEYPDGAYAAGVCDKGHLQEYGAKVYANMVARMLLEYDQDHSLDRLKALAAPVETQEIRKPERHAAASGNTQNRPADVVTNFVAQEVSVENGRGNFLLNWSPVEGAQLYHVYAKKKADLTFEIVRIVTKEEKESAATLPFAAEAGHLWEYYVTAVFENGSEGHASRTVAVQL